MENNENDIAIRVRNAKRSLYATLYLVSQTAQNIRELLPTGYITNPSPEEEAVLIRQQTVLSRLYKTINLIGSSSTEFNHERLSKLISECDNQREELRREPLMQEIERLTRKLYPNRKPQPLNRDSSLESETSDRR